MIGSLVVYYTVGLGMVVYYCGNELTSMGKESFDSWWKSDKSTKADVELQRLVPLALAGALADVKVAIRDEEMYDFINDKDTKEYQIR
jgi:hypothetical protein